MKMKELLKNKLIIGFMIFIVAFTFITSIAQEDTKKDLEAHQQSSLNVNK